MVNVMKKLDRRRQAFSLVEVTLALGIITISLVSLLGLIPGGLSSLQGSMDQTVHAQIVQKLSSEMAGSDFLNLTNQTCWFDGSGKYLGTAPSAPQDALYSVSLTEMAPSLPGLTNTSEVQSFSSHLKRIQIGIKRTVPPNSPTTWYATQIAAR